MALVSMYDVILYLVVVLGVVGCGSIIVDFALTRLGLWHGE